MKLRKLFVILLALLVVFSFVACDGSGGGSDDNGSTNGDNGGTNGDNGGNGGGNEDPPAETWTVRYFADMSGDGSGIYVDFFSNGSYQVGETDGTVSYSGGGGTYTGDPRSDGTVYVTGNWVDNEGGITEGEENLPISITSGKFVLMGVDCIRQ